MMPPHLRLSPGLRLLLLAVLAAPPGTAGVTIHEETLGESRITVAEPDDWNGGLVLFNHGHIPAHKPLTAYLPAAREPFAHLLAEGWLVAASSYRRNGVIIGEAMEDVAVLRDHLAETYGEPETTLLIGSSMGGAIALLLLEEQPEHYHGGLVLGRGLWVREENEPRPFTFRLTRPVLFLTNRSEREQALRYRAGVLGRIQQSDTNIVVPPVWTVERDGHIVFTMEEYRSAMTALLSWVETGEALQPRHDATIPAEMPASIATFHQDGRVTTTVTDISPTYGNVEIGLSAADLETLGLDRGDRLSLTTQDGSTVSVTLAASYGDVPAGAWVGFINEFLRLYLAINQGDAAAALGLTIGDPVTVRVSGA
ncbi:MAG: SAM hydroxide adenosyltransferase [Opitutales bacterium]